MTLSVDDEITITEVAVILIGIAITWAVYRRGKGEDQPQTGSVPTPGHARETADEGRRPVE
ncbi:MAG: hypothetical protein ABR888_07395 [Thermoplasmata archaeon]|jgi:hypothetical protein